MCLALTMLHVSATSVAAQDIPIIDRPSKPWPQVMVVGTVHFHNPGQDAVKSALDDVLSQKRQQEIGALVASLARFKPTKIAVERPPSEDATLNASYRGFLAGTYTLTRNEIDQVALRLAKQLGHPKVYPIDHRLGLDFNRALGFAAQNGQQDEVARFGATVQRIETYFSALYAKGTMSEIIAAQNSDAQADDGVALYQLMSRIGKDTTYVGADVATDWYKRNIRIYANILRLIDSPQDRVLVLIGGGHRPLLRQFFLQSPGYEFVPTLPYLR
jgi:opacity protein-like surface antigen